MGGTTYLYLAKTLEGGDGNHLDLFLENEEWVCLRMERRVIVVEGIEGRPCK